uniref:Uncharacterized protein n=1 Tax=Cucumis melo TaxID=3656 RepID=A0A9I9DN54_CUCME
ILKKNIQLHASPESLGNSAELAAEKLEWGNSDQITQVMDKHYGGFDLILGADIYIQKLVWHMRGQNTLKGRDW